MEGLGAGLAAFAFWGFIAAVVVGGIWYAVREKEAQHETLRRMIDSGRDLDEEAISRIFMDKGLSLIHISEPTRPPVASRMPSSA